VTALEINNFSFYFFIFSRESREAKTKCYAIFSFSSSLAVTKKKSVNCIYIDVAWGGAIS
jgi:hypothetical protein